MSNPKRLLTAWLDYFPETVVATYGRALTVALVAAVGARATAQECYFSTIPASTFTPFLSPLSAYDTVRSRILMADFSTSQAVRLYAWGGSSWMLLSANGPTQRVNAAMAFDGARDRLVIYGGISQAIPSFPSEVWEWDGQAWHVIPSEPGLFGRYQHGMVYDSARQRVVMFGGIYDTGVTNDLLEWDGVAWTGPGPLVRPPARRFPFMTFDSGRGSALLLGGFTQTLTSLSDFWEWDGAAWTQLPDPPSRGSITYDPTRARSFFWGSNQAWEFDGSSNLWVHIAQFGGGSGGPVGGGPLFDGGLSRIVFPAGNGLTLWDHNGSVVPPWIATQPVGGVFAPGVWVEISLQAGGTDPLSIQWHKQGQALVNGGNISGVQASTLRFSPFTSVDAGQYFAVVQNTCGTATTSVVGLASVSPCNSVCYANCDQSTGCPALTANDFMCFLIRYVAGESYANCDGVGGINVEDIICFLTAFNNGCP